MGVDKLTSLVRVVEASESDVTHPTNYAYTLKETTKHTTHLSLTITHVASFSWILTTRSSPPLSVQFFFFIKITLVIFVY